MSEVLEQEKAKALSEFNSGFSGTNEPPEEIVEEVAQPEYVQITKQQFDEFQSRLAEIENLKTAQAKTSGSIGTLNQVIEQLKSSTKQGAPVELTDDVVDGLKTEFGDELSGAVLAALKKAAPALRGTGQVQPFDPAQIKAQITGEVDSGYTARRTAELQKELTEEHPDWATVRDTPEFKAWKDSLKPDEKTRLDTTNSVSYLSRKLTEFKDSLKKKPVPKPNNRQAIIQAAVQPRGDGGSLPTKDALDDFHSGFYKKKPGNQ